MKKLLVKSMILGLVAASSLAMAAGNADAGKTKAAVCATCHNADGNSSVPIYPKLAGQHATYIESALKAYRDGQRKGGQSVIMTPMAKPLSDQDIADLAAFFSSQKAK